MDPNFFIDINVTCEQRKNFQTWPTYVLISQ